jgi:membrane-associated phospholipid phosphatase
VNAFNLFARVLVFALAGVFVLTLADSASAADPDRDDHVEWSPEWKRVRTWEAVDAIALTAASTALANVPSPSKPNFRGPILWDSAVRSALNGHTRQLQLDASSIGDAIFLYGVPGVFAVDTYVALGIHRNADVALQMALINLQSLGAAGVLSLGAERGLARERPYVRDCGPDGVVRDAQGRPLLNKCGVGGENISFFSGHAAATATMAGLTCVHHRHIPLYGGGAGDIAACVAMIGASLTTGVSRIVADKHYSTDVMFGWGVGAFMGYAVPSFLHYGWGHGRPLGEVRTGSVTMVPVPQASPTGGGLGVAGSF